MKTSYDFLPNKIIPENDTQELWEQNGRVQAVIAYCLDEIINNDGRYVNAKAVYTMLGGDPDGLSLCEAARKRV